MALALHFWLAELCVMQTTCPDYMVLDIRKFQPNERNFRVVSAFEAVAPHCSFMVVSDQEPASLRKEFDGELKGRFGWKMIQNGPPEWKFMITKMTR